LIGNEARLFRFTAKHSLIMLSLICLLTFLQAYWIKWIVPGYETYKIESAKAISEVSRGYDYLLILAVIIIAIVFSVVRMNKRKHAPVNGLGV
jgi:lactate permease